MKNKPSLKTILLAIIHAQDLFETNPSEAKKYLEDAKKAIERILIKKYEIN